MALEILVGLATAALTEVLRFLKTVADCKLVPVHMTLRTIDLPALALVMFLGATLFAAGVVFAVFAGALLAEALALVAVLAVAAFSLAFNEGFLILVDAIASRYGKCDGLRELSGVQRDTRGDRGYQGYERGSESQWIMNNEGPNNDEELNFNKQHEKEEEKVSKLMGISSSTYPSPVVVCRMVTMDDNEALTPIVSNNPTPFSTLRNNLNKQMRSLKKLQRTKYKETITM